MVRHHRREKPVVISNVREKGKKMTRFSACVFIEDENPQDILTRIQVNTVTI